MGLLSKIKNARLVVKIVREENSKIRGLNLEGYVQQIKTNPEVYGAVDPDKITLLDKVAEICKGYIPAPSCNAKGGCRCSENDPLKTIYTNTMLAGIGLRYTKSTGKLSDIAKQGFLGIDKEIVYMENKKP